MRRTTRLLVKGGGIEYEKAEARAGERGETGYQMVIPVAITGSSSPRSESMIGAVLSMCDLVSFEPLLGPYMT